MAINSRYFICVNLLTMKNTMLLGMLWCLANIFATGQTNTHRYKFIVHEPDSVLIDGKLVSYYGKDREFVSKRIYLSNDVYLEGGIFSRDTNNVNNFLKFKKNGDSWSISQENTWRLLIKKKKFKTPQIFLYDRMFYINWKAPLVINKTTLYPFTLKPIGFSMSEQSTYFFSLQLGIVALESSDGLMFVREDLNL